MTDNLKLLPINENDINESFVALEKTRDTIFSEKLDEHNKSLITDVMKSTINGLSDKVKSGAIKVHDYMSDNNCPG